jgi:hypothetical protein
MAICPERRRKTNLWNPFRVPVSNDFDLADVPPRLWILLPQADLHEPFWLNRHCGEDDELQLRFTHNYRRVLHFSQSRKG